MWWLPYLKTTLVSPFSGEKIRQKMADFIRPQNLQNPSPSEMIYLGRKPTKEYPFNGNLHKKGFRIFRNLYYTEHFTPLILGEIEDTSKGCILFIRYRLFAGTLFFLLLGAFVFICTAFVFLLIERNILSFLLCLLFFGGAYAVMLLNFHQKVQISKNLLEKILRE